MFKALTSSALLELLVNRTNKQINQTNRWTGNQFENAIVSLTSMACFPLLSCRKVEERRVQQHSGFLYAFRVLHQNGLISESWNL